MSKAMDLSRFQSQQSKTDIKVLRETVSELLISLIKIESRLDYLEGKLDDSDNPWSINDV